MNLKFETPKKPEVKSSTCAVCGGVVTGDYVWKCHVPRSEVIFGPGSRSQYSWSFTGYHCQSCGLKYEFLPKLNK